LCPHTWVDTGSSVKRASRRSVGRAVEGSEREKTAEGYQ